MSQTRIRTRGPHEMLIIAQVFFWILGMMFFVGAIGSALVVILTSIHDVKDIREPREPEPAGVTGNMTSLKSSEWA
jgi:hypothetical protein